MRLFKNENYTDFYTEPPVLSLEDVLYVEVNMERPLVSDIDSSSNVSNLAPAAWFQISWLLFFESVLENFGDLETCLSFALKIQTILSTVANLLIP